MSHGPSIKQVLSQISDLLTAGSPLNFRRKTRCSIFCPLSALVARWNNSVLLRVGNHHLFVKVTKMAYETRWISCWLAGPWFCLCHLGLEEAWATRKLVRRNKSARGRLIPNSSGNTFWPHPAHQQLELRGCLVRGLFVMAIPLPRLEVNCFY